MKIQPTLLWRYLIHDWSKLTPGEWIPYTKSFYYDYQKGTIQYIETREKFNFAWNHHQKINKHHWQYWLMTPDNGKPVALRMPHKYVVEMVADWASAGRVITSKWEVAEWYKKNCEKIILHQDTRTEVKYLLDKYFEYDSPF